MLMSSPFPAGNNDLVTSHEHDVWRSLVRFRDHLVGFYDTGNHIWLWLKKPVPNWNPGKCKHGLKPA